VITTFGNAIRNADRESARRLRPSSQGDHSG
jgi:hypothetical protein